MPERKGITTVKRIREALRKQAASRRAAAALAVVLLTAGLTLPSPFVTVAPGPVVSLGKLVSLKGRQSVGEPFYMVTVSVKEARWYEALAAAVDHRAAVRNRRTITGGRDLAEYSREMADLMKDSRQRAIRLSYEAAKAPCPEQSAGLVCIGDSEVLGPSAGLAFALQLSGILLGEDLTGGKRVAATGVLNDRGQILAVGGIEQKAISCRKNGIEVFIVPASNFESASRLAKGITVVPVKTLSEAIIAARSLARPIP